MLNETELISCNKSKELQIGVPQVFDDIDNCKLFLKKFHAATTSTGEKAVLVS